MSKALTEGTIRSEWTMIPVGEITIKERLRRRLDDSHVKRLMESFTDLGFQIHPITVDEYHTLIAGEHRLEAMRRLTEKGIPGWDQIGALVVTGATEHDQRWIELEENQARRQMSPIEIQKAWETYGAPVFKARAKQRQVVSASFALAARGIETESMVIGNTNNHAEPEPVALPTAAKLMTGQSIEWLNKVAEIQALAESESAPAELREAAQQGVLKLSKPEAPVEPVYKSLLKMQDAILRAKDPQAARARELESKLDSIVREVTLLEEKLQGTLAGELREAALVAPMGAEMLRAVRVSLAKALACVVAVECEITNDKTVTLNVIGGEVTRLLSEQSIQKLGLKTNDHDC